MPVQQAPRRYQAVMARQIAQVNGSRREAEASGVVLAAVARYREACERLAVARAGGPQYRELDALPTRLSDATRPEEVALSDLAGIVLERIGDRQRRIDREDGG